MRSTDCKNKPSCGWSASQKKYTCGTGGGIDPSGTYPMSCSAYQPDVGLPPPIGDGSPPPPIGDGSPPPPGDGGPVGNCYKLTVVGCCRGDKLDYCKSGQMTTTDCKGKPKCGWNASQKKYACGTSGGSDPGGKFPKSCMSYLPDIGVPPPVGDSSTPPPGDGKPPPPGDSTPPPPGDSKPPPPGDSKPPPPTDGKLPPPTDGKLPPPTDGKLPPTDGKLPPTDGKLPPTDGKLPPTDGKPKPDDSKEPDASRPDQGKAAGTEGGPCYPNDTCNKGLKCLSSLCVKVPVDAFIPPIVNKRDETGCSCSTTSAPSSWPLVLLALGLVVLRRRRESD